MFAKITVRGEANAQALFDVLHGKGITWSQPFNTRGYHILIIERPENDLNTHLKNIFPGMKFKMSMF